MKQCSKCNLWFSEDQLNADELQCIRCNAPWSDYDDAPPGLSSKPVPLHMSRAAFELLEKAEVNITRFEICLPMPGDPSKYLSETSIYQGEGRYWYIEGRDQKFKNDNEALVFVIEMAEARRHKLLNEAFEEAFGDS